MFGVGWGEILMVMIVAVLVVPAKDWPRFFYQLGRWVRIARNIVDDAKRDFEKALYTDDIKNLHNDLKKITFDAPKVIQRPTSPYEGGGAEAERGGGGGNV